MKNIVFTGRHNNDLDWGIPLVDTMKDSYNVHLFLLSPEISRGDFRIKYITEQQNVFVYFIEDIISEKFYSVMASVIWSRFRKNNLLRKLYYSIGSKIMNRLDWDDLFGKRLKALEPAAIFMDRVKPSSSRNKYPPYGVSSFIYFGKKEKIPLYSFPHGLLLFQLSTDYLSLSEYFDFIISYGPSDERNLLSSGISSDKIVKSGSTRYDISWLNKLDNLLEISDFPNKSNYKYMLTFFATKMVYEYDFEKLLKWLLDIAEKFPNLLLIVQPHPRGQKKKAFSKLESVENIIIDTNTPSSILVRMSDAVSTLVSSVVVEAIVLNKPLLYPKFLHNMETEFERDKACIKIDSADESFDIINELILGEYNMKDLENNYIKFLNNNVYFNRNRNTTSFVLNHLNSHLAVSI